MAANGDGGKLCATAGEVACKNLEELGPDDDAGHADAVARGVLDGHLRRQAMATSVMTASVVTLSVMISGDDHIYP